MEPRIDWPRNDYSRVPFRLHHDPALYELEMERIFRGPAWSFLCLEAEIPNPGDYRTTWVGDTPVIVSRDKAGAIHAFVNRCSQDRKSTRLNSSHQIISYAVFCLKKKKNRTHPRLVVPRNACSRRATTDRTGG